MKTNQSKTKTYDVEKYKQQQKEIAKELQGKIETYAKSYVETPERLAELAAFKAKFYSYSYKNTVLIFNQNPYATFVGSFEKFRKIGRELTENLPDPVGYIGVKKGEKGMKIYVPVKSTIALVDKEKNEWKSISTLSKAEQDLVKRGLIESKEILSFKIGTVFDISQTNIPPEVYPEIFSLGHTSDEHRKIFEGLKNCIENKYKCPVTIGIDNSISLRGACYSDKIKLNTRLKDTQLLSTLSHEFGHFLMHNNPDNKISNRSLIELEADIYSIMLESHFGIPTNDTRKSHLADAFRSCTKNMDESAKATVIENAFNKASVVFSQSIDDIEKSISEVSNAHNFNNDQNQYQQTLFETECDESLEL